MALVVSLQRSRNSLDGNTTSTTAEVDTFTDSGTGTSTEDEETTKTSSARSLSECYFAGNSFSSSVSSGAAVSLPSNPHIRVSSPSSDIERHLRSMFYLLRPQETLKMAVKLESVHLTRTRYLVVVSCNEGDEESCLLGIDCNETTTVGLVLRVLADTTITLDGDGGFSVSVCGRIHIFKPVSVQAMWSALQTLHKVSQKARDKNYFQNGGTHDWVEHYEDKIESDRSCLNEWYAMDSIESRRPPSPDSLRHKPSQRQETEMTIKSTLKEIMMSVDLDDVTSKYIRTRLEEQLDMDLGEFKPFIDEEMLVILGQMDAATQIFPHVYLGSEWNASNLEELSKHGVNHILNVTREIDNFFPGMFDYLNIRVYDDDKTDLLKHWDDTYKYITSVKNQGSKVLVHCKMGISRSASVVIAYAMKAYNWDLNKALAHVRDKRNCIKPNSNFIAQLETYQGILDAMKNREKLQRSKSETNLKCNSITTKESTSQLSRSQVETRCSSVTKEEESPITETQIESPISRTQFDLLQMPSGSELTFNGSRPKSWSPEAQEIITLLDTSSNVPTSQSLEGLSSCSDEIPCIPPAPPLPPVPKCYNLNVRMRCDNGLSYSVSPNKILHLPVVCTQSTRTCEGGVKDLVNALEANNSQLSSSSLASFNPHGPIESKPFPQSSSLASQTQYENVGNQSSSKDKTGCTNLKSGFKSASSLISGNTDRLITSSVINDKKSRFVLNLTSQFEPPSSTVSNELVKPIPSSLSSSSSSCSSSNISSPSKETKETKGMKYIQKHKIPPDNRNVMKIHESTNEKQREISPKINELKRNEPASSLKSSDVSLSRQNSWSSQDSAIVIESVSRQNSWGSYDTSKKQNTQNQITKTCSLGSYDAKSNDNVRKKHDHLGKDTVHSQKINENCEITQETNVDNQNSVIQRHDTLGEKSKMEKTYYDKRKNTDIENYKNVISSMHVQQDSSNSAHAQDNTFSGRVNIGMINVNEPVGAVHKNIVKETVEKGGSKQSESEKDSQTQKEYCDSQKHGSKDANLVKISSSQFTLENKSIWNPSKLFNKTQSKQPTHLLNTQNSLKQNEFKSAIQQYSSVEQDNSKSNNIDIQPIQHIKSQSKFNYSNSYPQPFSNKQQKINQKLSKSSPNIEIIEHLHFNNKNFIQNPTVKGSIQNPTENDTIIECKPVKERIKPLLKDIKQKSSHEKHAINLPLVDIENINQPLKSLVNVENVNESDKTSMKSDKQNDSNNVQRTIDTKIPVEKIPRPVSEIILNKNNMFDYEVKTKSLNNLTNNYFRSISAEDNTEKNKNYNSKVKNLKNEFESKNHTTNATAALSNRQHTRHYSYNENDGHSKDDEKLNKSENNLSYKNDLIQNELTSTKNRPTSINNEKLDFSTSKKLLQQNSPTLKTCPALLPPSSPSSSTKKSSSTTNKKNNIKIKIVKSVPTENNKSVKNIVGRFEQKEQVNAIN